MYTHIRDSETEHFVSRLLLHITHCAGHGEGVHIIQSTRNNKNLA